MTHLKRLVGLLMAILFVLSMRPVLAQNQKANTDGLWFLGFNLQKNLWKGERGRRLRHAIFKAIPREEIALQIVQSPIVPQSFVPPGFIWSNATEESPAEMWPANNLTVAKQEMKKLRISTRAARLKNILLLHTDGVQTIQIAEAISKSLAALGFQMKRRTISYNPEEIWESELATGESHLFLMGYKASEGGGITTLLDPLFHSNGAANFSDYHNPVVDRLLEQLALIPTESVEERQPILQQINQELFRDLPVIPLFYIPRL